MKIPRCMLRLETGLACSVRPESETAAHALSLPAHTSTVSGDTPASLLHAS